MTLSFSFQDHAISFAFEAGLRIAASAAYAVYSLPGGGQHKAAVNPKVFSETETSLTDVHGDGSQTCLRGSTADGLELVYRLNQYTNRSFLLLRFSVRNLGPEAVQLHQLVLLEARAGQILVDPPGSGFDFYKAGWHGWAYSGLHHTGEGELRTLLGKLIRNQYSNPTSPLGRYPGEFCSEQWAILAGKQAAVVVGLASTADQFGQVYAWCNPGALGMRLVTQADGILLEPGEALDSEWGYLQVLPLPAADPAHDYICAVARQMGARQRTSPPALQWTHWYHFFHDISAQKFITNLDAINAVRDRVPFQVVQLDDGYQSAWGEWTTTNAKFPAGLGDLAEQISRAGYTPGLWLAPFVVQPGSQVDREHPDWLLRGPRGRPVNAGFFYQFFGRALDTTHPAVQDHLRALAEALTQRWGYGLLKLDFCYAVALPGRRSDPHATRAQALRRGLECFRQAGGETTFLLGCGCPFGPAIGVVDAMRIGPDTAPTWEPFFNWLPWVSPLLRREPSPPSLRNSLRHLLNLSCLHRRWWWNDPDCLLVRDQETYLTEAEVRSSVSLVGLSGGMVVDSDDLTTLPPERLELLSLLTPILSPGGRALDLLQSDMPELYHVPLQGSAGCWHLVGLFNWQNCPASKGLSLVQLGFFPGQWVFVFDFWAQRGWFTRESELAFPEIPAHGCRLLRICALEPDAPSAPWLLGDTLHITQGLEIAAWQAEPDRLEIMTVNLDRQVRGGLWLRLPSHPAKAICNRAAVNLAALGNDIYQIPLDFNGQAMIALEFSNH